VVSPALYQAIIAISEQTKAAADHRRADPPGQRRAHLLADEQEDHEAEQRQERGDHQE
jgi:hypothetical protein